MTNRVSAGFFSLTPPAPPDDDGSYLRWHLLDHMPEQYAVPGIVLGTRWVADDEYAAHRIAADGDLTDVGGVVCYLMAEPVQRTFDEFMDLAARLRDVGRFPELRPSLQARLLALGSAQAAPKARVTAEVVPFRPHRGVLLLVEKPNDDATAWHDWIATEHEAALLDVPGVAGVWSFHSTDAWTLRPHCEGPPQRITVIYLDADPLAMTKSLTSYVEQRWASHAVRPLFAGPLRSMVDWDAWPRPEAGA